MIRGVPSRMRQNGYRENHLTAGRDALAVPDAALGMIARVSPLPVPDTVPFCPAVLHR